MRDSSWRVGGGTRETESNLKDGWKLEYARTPGI